MQAWRNRGPRQSQSEYTGAMPDGSTAATPVPGAVVVWTGAEPTIQAFRIPPAGLVIGRELLDNTTDDRISRQHARVAWRDKRFIVTDLGSRNGTYAGGNPLVDREVTVTAPSVVRTGRTVSVLLEDIRRFEGAAISSEHDAIVGPSTAPLWSAVEQAARADDNLLIVGEPGTGKGRLARGYARARNRHEAVFNPTIQAVPLERVVSAMTETLILEQVGKLGAQNLATLVKLIERRNLRFVTTAAMQLEHFGLEPELAAALSTRSIVVPPLRDRPDEMTFPGQRRGARSRARAADRLDAARGLPVAAVAGERARADRRGQPHRPHGRGAGQEEHPRRAIPHNDAGHLMVGAPTLNAAVQATALGKPRRKRNSSRPSNE